MDNLNIDNLKSMLDNSDLSSLLSQVPPDLIEKVKNIQNSENPESSTNKETSHENIDVESILKAKNIIEKMNKSSNNDPRSNLLYSLKPYLRDEKKEKLDQYIKILKFTDIAKLLNTDKKDD